MYGTRDLNARVPDYISDKVSEKKKRVNMFRIEFILGTDLIVVANSIISYNY